jgi:hypothetical protein
MSFGIQSLYLELSTESGCFTADGNQATQKNGNSNLGVKWVEHPRPVLINAQTSRVEKPGMGNARR